MQENLSGKINEYKKNNIFNSNNEILNYHNKNHTLDVLKRSIRIANLIGLSRHDKKLLYIAALFHDYCQEFDLEEINGLKEFRRRKRKIGQNEENSFLKAEEYMKIIGSFSEIDITRVKNAILGTTPFFKENQLLQRAFYDENGKPLEDKNVDIITRVLAIADLNSSCFETPKQAFLDATNVFLEDFTDLNGKGISLTDLLNNDELLKRYLSFINSQKTFINNRRKNIPIEIGNLNIEINELYENIDNLINLIDNILENWKDFIEKLRNSKDSIDQDFGKIVESYLNS